jgi:hypothetical protein
MDCYEIQSLLDAHSGELREIVRLRKGDLSAKVAEKRLNAFWKSACHLATIADTEEMGARQRSQAWALIRISRETISVKRDELVYAGFGVGERKGPDDDDGSPGVLAFVKPVVPPRVGHDAKAFPPEEIAEGQIQPTESSLK